MIELTFTKIQATGNDFILVDARDSSVRQSVLQLTRAQIAKLCDRRFGVGADGFILLLHHPDYDFEMKNYNLDGGECTMCGNGARALLRFAALRGIRKTSYRFLAIDGIHEGRIENDLIHLKMSDVPAGIPTPLGMTFNTGSPHLICKVSGIQDYPVVVEGRKNRNSPLFAPAGINSNFIEEIGGELFIRTYERGVEDETLSCGTGAIAAALALQADRGSAILRTRGGNLRVQFKKTETGFENIWLIGPAEITFEGTYPCTNTSVS